MSQIKETDGQIMNVQILATGSGGNCVLIDNHILIDAGITIKAFSAYELDLSEIWAFVITHKHTDHMKTPLVRFLLQNHIKAFLPKAVIAELLAEGKLDVMALIASGQISQIEAEKKYQIGNLKMTPYAQKHHDIVNFAFVLEKEEERLLYSTDLDTVEPTETGVGLLHLGKFDTILLEGNYDETYLRAYIEHMISLVPEAEDPTKSTDMDLEKWVKANYRQLPEDVARNAFRAIQNHRHLSKQQARAYVINHLKPNGVYYEIHRSSQFYEEPDGWRKD